MADVSDALRVVVGLAEKATPGPWTAEGADVSAHHVAADPRLQYWVCEDMNGDTRHGAISGRPTDNAETIAAAVNFIREHGAALAQALENDARWRSFRRTISINADDMTPERWDKREDSFMADYADAYDPAAIAAQQKEAANGD